MQTGLNESWFKTGRMRGDGGEAMSNDFVQDLQTSESRPKPIDSPTLSSF